MQTSSKIRKLIAVGVFIALAYICCVLFHFKVAFLSFELKDAIMTIAAMFFGPLAGIASVFIVCFIEFITISGTGVYGLIMNILASLTFVFIGSFVYTKKRRMSGAILGMTCASISMVVVMLIANLLITPYYLTSLGNTSSVQDIAAMIPSLLLPFNLTKAVFNSAIVFLLYKPISTALKSAGFVRTGAIEHKHEALATDSVYAETFVKPKHRFVFVWVIAALLAVASLLYFFTVLGGSFTISK